VCGEERRRIYGRRRGPRTRQRIGESHRSPGGIATVSSYGLRRRSGLWSLASRRFPVPPHSQWRFVFVVRKVNNMRRSYEKNSIDQSYKKSSVDSRQNISNHTRVGSNSIFHLLIIVLGGDLRSSSTANFERPSVGAVDRPRIRPRSTKENKFYHYPEMVGTVILILGRALGGLDGAARGCLGAFSVSAGEEVRGRFDDCPTGAVTLPRSRAGSCVSWDRPSARGGPASSSSSSSLESTPSSPSPSSSDSHSPCSSPLLPPLASPSSACPCAPLGVEYISVVAWRIADKSKVSRPIQREQMKKARSRSGTQGQTWSTSYVLSSVTTLLAPRGLSLFPVMLDSHPSSISSVTSSG